MQYCPLEGGGLPAFELLPRPWGAEQERSQSRALELRRPGWMRTDWSFVLRIVRRQS